MSWAYSWASEKRRAEERSALRAQVEAGERDKACELVVKDPRRTRADMQCCREALESLGSPDARWRELEKFLTAGGHFESFNPKELGFTPTWDFNKSLVVVRHDQEWFLLARPETFSTPEGLLRLGGGLPRHPPGRPVLPDAQRHQHGGRGAGPPASPSLRAYFATGGSRSAR
jgi:hypothetical protein